MNLYIKLFLIYLTSPIASPHFNPLADYLVAKIYCITSLLALIRLNSKLFLFFNLSTSNMIYW